MSFTTGRKTNQRTNDNLEDPFDEVDKRVDAIEAVKAMHIEEIREHIRHFREAYSNGPGRAPTQEHRDEVRRILREQMPWLEEYTEADHLALDEFD